jgi:hypothetical protein
MIIIKIKDLFSNLPLNWAQLDFKNKKNCIANNISSTSVTNAINKLENLQNSIEKWFLFLSFHFKFFI